MTLKKLLFLLVLIMLLTACSNEKKASTQSNGNDGVDISGVIQNKLGDKYENINDFKIEHTEDYEEQHKFVMFTFLSNTKEYEGISYLKNHGDNFQVSELDIAQIDKKVPFTNHGLSGELSLEEKVHRPYRIVSGYVNNGDIEEVMIYFKNQKNISIRLNEKQKTFMYVLVGFEESPKEILGLDQGRDVVHSY